VWKLNQNSCSYVKSGAWHIENILRKLHASNRAEATSRYLRLTLNRVGEVRRGFEATAIPCSALTQIGNPPPLAAAPQGGSHAVERPRPRVVF
jgi:hypothetical protein